MEKNFDASYITKNPIKKHWQSNSPSARGEHKEENKKNTATMLKKKKKKVD